MCWVQYAVIDRAKAFYLVIPCHLKETDQRSWPVSGVQYPPLTLIPSEPYNLSPAVCIAHANVNTNSWIERASKPLYPVFLICSTWKPINNFFFFETHFSTKKRILKSQVKRADVYIAAQGCHTISVLCYYCLQSTSDTYILLRSSLMVIKVNIIVW